MNEDVVEKPPLGVMPKDIWMDIRIVDLLEAMQRYMAAGKVIPFEWVDELGELVDRAR